MKKIFITIFFVFLISSCSLFTNNATQENKKEEITETGAIKKQEKKLTGGEVNSKIEHLRKKVKLKGLIASGDIFSAEDNYLAAILKYKQALSEIPKDKELNKKIGDLYYEIKNFKKANDYYGKIKDYEKLDKDRAIKSLVNAKTINPGNIVELKQEIASFNINSEKEFYYTTSLDCVLDYSNCRDEFEIYFNQNLDIKDENLLNIKKSLENFENFGQKDLYYKASFISGAFFENGFYYLSLKTSEDVLSEKRDYKPMIKVAAKSAYEIGKYELAKDYLLQNKKLDSHDYEVSYFLARIYEKLNNETLAIVHYKKSINNGNPDVANIYRRLIFIYFEQDEMEKMLLEFDKLLKLKEGINKTDFSLAIYYNILDNNLMKAKNYSLKAMKTSPESETFYSYFSWILLQDDDISDTEMKIISKNIEKAFKINSKNPTTLMVKGIYEFKNGNYTKSLVFLKNAYGLDKGGEYKEEINFWLKKVEEARNKNN